MTRFPIQRVLLLYSATGSGHRSVAKAIGASITEISNANCCEIEVFEAVKLPLIGAWPASYSWMATRSVWLYNLLFRVTDAHWVSTKISGIIYMLAKRSISEILKNIDPDIIVVTAPFVSEVAVRARRDLRADFRIINVVCDLVTPHASWACHGADVTVVCSPLAKGRLRKAGMRDTKIVETPFPVQGAFYEDAIGKEQSRRKLGLQPERFTIMLSGGSLGAGPIASSARALNKAFPDAQLLIIAGHNERLFRLLRSQFSAELVRVYGFTDQMPVLLRGSDVVVSKGGPSSIMEAYAAKRPVIVISEIGLQERGNGNLIQRLGIGFQARSVEELVAIIETLRCNVKMTETEGRLLAINGSRAVARIVLRAPPLSVS